MDLFLGFQQRPQSEFKVAATLDDLMESKDDAIHWIDAPEKAKGGFLQDIGCGAYIYKLHDAVFYPDRALQAFASQGVPTEFPSAKGDLRFRHNSANLLLTGNRSLFSESFGRNKLVHHTLSGTTIRGSTATELPDVQVQRDGECFFGEFFTTHFGHALIDMLGRFWPFALPRADRFEKMPVAGVERIGFRNGNFDGGPTFFRDMVSACGISFQNFLFLTEPTQFSTLYVPSRVAPYFNNTGPRYNALMQMIGKRLLGDSLSSQSKRVFLSRSHLPIGKRSLNPETERLVETIFSRHGFEIVHPQEISFAEQILKVRTADRLAGLVGSQMHLAVFSNSTAPKMFRVRPKFHPVPWDFAILDSLGGSLHDFVAEDFGAPNKNDRPDQPKKRSWDISPEDLTRLDEDVTQWLAS